MLLWSFFLVFLFVCLSCSLRFLGQMIQPWTKHQSPVRLPSFSSQSEGLFILFFSSNSRSRAPILSFGHRLVLEVRDTALPLCNMKIFRTEGRTFRLQSADWIEMTEIRADGSVSSHEVIGEKTRTPLKPQQLSRFGSS